MAGEPLIAEPERPGRSRRDVVRDRLLDEGVSALLVTSLPNVFYLTGFTGSSAALIVSAAGGDVVITDGRYATQVGEEIAPDLEVSIRTRGLLDTARERLVADRAASVAIEARHLSVAEWEAWSEAGGPALVPVRDWVESQRVRKEEREIRAIREAGRIAAAAFDTALEAIRPGIEERELADAVERAMIENGASGPAFETIALFGERTALPHGRSGRRELRTGELVLLDFGAVRDGYRSDMTRTVAYGQPREPLGEVYDIVREAQRSAIDGLRSGATGADVDACARDLITQAGFGDDFLHSVGHGVGIEVHEKPSLATRSEDRLEPDMVVTVEPGIYIEGSGGVRIEDLVRVTSGAHEILTEAPKDELIVL